MFFQRPCAGCGSPPSVNRSVRGPLCVRCAATLEPVGPLGLDSLGAGSQGAESLGAESLGTESPHGLVGLSCVGALVRYDGPARSAIVAAKSGARPDVLRAFGPPLGRLALAVTEGRHRPAVVTWVPASRRGARDRGYDQGRLLARSVAAALGLPVHRLLVRGPDSSRMGRGRVDRLSGPELRVRGRFRGPVLVVDDVITTGASITAAARALRSTGVSSVAGIAVAWVASAEEVAAGRRHLELGAAPGPPSWKEAPSAPASAGVSG